MGAHLWVAHVNRPCNHPALASLTFNFDVFLQGTASGIQPWPLLVHYPHLLLFHHQDFKLWNSLGPQNLTPPSHTYQFVSLPLLWTPDPLDARIQIFSSVLGSLAPSLAWVPRTCEAATRVAAESQVHCPPLGHGGSYGNFYNGSLQLKEERQ